MLIVKRVVKKVRYQISGTKCLLSDMFNKAFIAKLATKLTRYNYVIMYHVELLKYVKWLPKSKLQKVLYHISAKCTLVSKTRCL